MDWDQSKHDEVRQAVLGLDEGTPTRLTFALVSLLNGAPMLGLHVERQKPDPIATWIITAVTQQRVIRVEGGAADMAWTPDGPPDTSPVTAVAWPKSAITSVQLKDLRELEKSPTNGVWDYRIEISGLRSEPVAIPVQEVPRSVSSRADIDALLAALLDDHELPTWTTVEDSIEARVGRGS